MDYLETRAREAVGFLAQRHRRRSLYDFVQPHPGGIDLTHSDYLALGKDPVFQGRCLQKASAFPVGAGGSRLLGGGWDYFNQVEAKFAAFKGAESSLLFSSGYSANAGLLSALALSGRVSFFSDQWNHASLVDGVKHSPLPKQHCFSFRHNDLDHLEAQLKASKAKCPIIITEALFSMDGDFAPVKELSQLAQIYGGVVVMDEAHALACYGASGEGLCAQWTGYKEHLITVNPCGKGMGVHGAFVCGPHWLKDLLIHKARGFMFSTAPSLWIAAALDVALDYIPTLGERRKVLYTHTGRLRQILSAHFDLGTSNSHVVPVFLGDESSAMALAAYVRGKGIYVQPIRPPTVAEGRSRVRISLNAGLTYRDIEAVGEHLCAYKAGLKQDS